MFLYASVFIFYVVIVPFASSASFERILVCSSEDVSIWYSYEGPLYYLSGSVYPCSFRRTTFTVTYTIIPMFTLVRIGYNARIYFKNQLLLEHKEPYVLCEDAKICYIIKGETLHETCPVYFKRNTFFALQGEYQMYMEVNIIDDVKRMLTLRFNITVHIKSGSKKAILQQLGGL